MGDRSVYADDLKSYEVEQMAAKFPDPYRYYFTSGLETLAMMTDYVFGPVHSAERPPTPRRGRPAKVSVRVPSPSAWTLPFARLTLFPIFPDPALPAVAHWPCWAR